ncbi:MAG: isoprenyl transferase [Candidatus Omnitrophica bacterium]|nr:isoprenyl transferase [Candidatus Omnitrophota bacterium]
MKREKNKKKEIMPVHIAIVMDGNGRWAQKKNLPRIEGHRAGLESVRKIVKAADKCGVKCLTLYSFSTENWKRPRVEVEFLFRLMEHRLRTECKNLCKNNVKVNFIGRRGQLPQVLKKTMADIEKMTGKNTGLNLVFAINYGSRQEITDAVKKIVRSGVPEKDVTEELIEKNLYTGKIPPPDLIIRTSGEKRISNFLLWQAAYAEFYFTPVLWPDFGEEDFLKAVGAYGRRKRRFGGIKNGN